MELIPPQPGEVYGYVNSINDAGTALVESDDVLGRTYLLYSKGEATPLDLGPTVTSPTFYSLVTSGGFINNQGIIAGTVGCFSHGSCGFRFDPRTGVTTVLNPLPTEP